ncbi:SWIM zinc finger family protein [Methanofollis tationis]|uniref:SWIM zinc finger family protein n=1 Tax=Methanofollis tationis TaxID=81417 RepID=A0A7K4HRC0_9EURY|nr:SWIM zinc finger family protein [Methanofollis tationis]NVO67834.1 SWIM zinc finger family protein [Methanofollis tationis]
MKELFDRIGREDLTPSLREAILRAYRDRGRKALAAVDAGAVRRYLDFFVVRGRTAEYVVEDDFCTCKDFTYRGGCCWHILAVRIALASDRFERREEWYIDRLRKEGITTNNIMNNSE